MCYSENIMFKYCPICKTKYPEEKDVCLLDGMRLFSKGDNILGSLIAERYKIEKKIGSGGMAVVYKAIDLRNGEERAVKLLRKELLCESKQRVRFLREARAVGLIRHENVVEIFQVGETDGGQAFMVMEYLEGPTIGDIIEQGDIPVSKALRVIFESARGLHKAHERNILHRDVKPDNLILASKSCGTQCVKLIDFGLAIVKGEPGLTATGQVFGTPEYLSPEQATGGDASPASDQYSLGILFYEMLTGKPPFVGAPANVLLSHFKHEPVPPSRIGHYGDISSDVEQIVLKMLAKRPADRFVNLSVLCEVLQPMIAREG